MGNGRSRANLLELFDQIFPWREDSETADKMFEQKETKVTKERTKLIKLAKFKPAKNLWNRDLYQLDQLFFDDCDDGFGRF